MKKKIIMLAVAGACCLGSVAAAATSEYNDVPLSHWSYNAIGELTKAGIINNGTLPNDRIMTRHEMAQIVANAMTKADKASDGNKILIDKLVKEYADELQAIDMLPVKKAEPDNDRFHYFGLFGNRYDHMDKEGITDKSSVMILNTYYKVNDKFTFVTENELHRMYSAQGEQWNSEPVNGFPDARSNWQHFGLQCYVDGQFDGMSTKLGRFTYMPAFGITHGEYLQVAGAQVSFGKTVKTTLVAGENTMYVPGGTFASMGYQAADMVFPVSSDTNIKFAYQRNQSNLGLAPNAAYTYGGLLHNDDYINYFEGGFESKLNKDLKLEAAYLKNSYDNNNKGYYVQLKYKNAIPFVPKTYDFYITYHNLESQSIMYNDLRYYPNMKGVRIGAHYAPWDSTLLTVWYDMQKYIDDGTSQPYGAKSATAGERDNFFRMQFDFFFK